MEGTEETTVEQSSADVILEPPSEPEPKATGSASNNADQPMEDAAPQHKIPRDREDDDDEDRPNKRAKTEDDEPEPNRSNSSIDLTGQLTPARAKFVLGVVRSLRRTKDARPFTMPVDAVKLNIPTYYDMIAKPMELQTMERKLNNNEYADVESFVDDFKQIVENCIAFNGPEHTITQMSKSMESAFYRHMKDLPGEDVQDIEKPKLSKKKGSLSGAAAISAAKGAAKAVATKTAKKKQPKSTAQSPTAPSPIFSLQPSGMPQIRRDSTVGDGRPKREIHPPAPKDLPYSTKPRRKQNAAELKFCDTIVKELRKKTHEAYAFPFYNPVDPVALNIPEYFRIIKSPMDLSTIQHKLQMNAYESADEFEADIRLMFNNCYKFNPEGQAVHQMGRQLEGIFDQKWKDKPLYTNNQGSRSPQSASPAPHDEEEMSEDEDIDEQQNIAELEKQLERMKEEISAMKKGQKKKSPPAQNAKSKSKSTGRKTSTSNAVPSKKSRKKDVPYVSLDQKTELSERINLLPPNKMHYALTMIKEMMPELGNDGAEIELDIDELDPHTLHKLYKYVSKNAPELPAKYVPPPPPPPPEYTVQETKPKARVGPKGRKNKPMTASEQEAKIEALQSRIASFENPGAYTPAAADESDSSDDDESSNSESEEE